MAEAGAQPTGVYADAYEDDEEWLEDGGADNSFSAADMAAIAAITAGNRATNQALTELARAIAARNGVDLPAPQPQPHDLTKDRLTDFVEGQHYVIVKDFSSPKSASAKARGSLTITSLSTLEARRNAGALAAVR